MAIMHPPQLPMRIRNTPKLKGEVDAFDALSHLPDEFVIFYNRCANNARAGQAFERQIDFIIIHEHLGLLAMEVKGGKIHIGDDGGFEQYQYRKGWKTIDPHAQVKHAVRDLIDVIKSDSPKYWIPDNVCVLFPGTHRAELTNIPQDLPPGTLCADDMPLLKTVVPSLFPKNTKAAWPRDVFIDVRRRLQNMPQAKDRTATAAASAGPQKIHAAKPQQMPAVKKPDPPPRKPQPKITIKQYVPPDTPRPARPKPRKKRLSVLDSLLAAGLVALIVLLVAWLCLKA